MTKEEIINEIAHQTNIEKVIVRKTVEAFMETVKGSIIEGDSVFLRGFGTFTLKKRAEKKGRNISKNTTVIIPAHNIPFFKPGKDFMRKVKQSNSV